MEINNPGQKTAAQLPQRDLEKQLLCETLADGSQVKFYRVTEYLDGVFNSVQDLNQDGTAYAVVDEANVAICPPPQIVEKTIGRERLSLTDAAAGSLTVPASADSARFSIVSGCGFLSDDGTTVLADGTIGHSFAQGGSGSICGDDMADFSAIAATGETLEIEVTYKQCVQK